MLMKSACRLGNAQHCALPVRCRCDTRRHRCHRHQHKVDVRCDEPDGKQQRGTNRKLPLPRPMRRLAFHDGCTPALARIWTVRILRSAVVKRLSQLGIQPCRPFQTD